MKKNTSYKMLISNTIMKLILVIQVCGCASRGQFTEGLKLYKRNKYSEAIIYFDQALKNNDKSNQAAFYKAMCLYELGSVDEAIYILAELGNKNPDDVSRGQISYALGGLLNSKGEYERAFSLYYSTILLGYEYKSLYTNTGLVLLNMGECRRAIPFLRKDYERNTYNNNTLVALSDGYSCIGNTDSANYFKDLVRVQDSK